MGWPYPWNDNIADRQCLIYSNIKGLDSRIFGICNEYYILYDQSLAKAYDTYLNTEWEQLSKLSHGIMMFSGSDRGWLRWFHETQYSRMIMQYAQRSLDKKSKRLDNKKNIESQKKT